MKSEHYLGFYRWMIAVAFLPYLLFIFPFLPSTIAGFNITGWAWLLMWFGVCGYYMATSQAERRFPMGFWIPWISFLVLYVALDYSVAGLQLTLQYLLPIFVGYVASGFEYSRERLHRIFWMFFKFSLLIVGLFFWGYLFRMKYVPMGALTPMLLSITAILIAGMYFMTGKVRYLFLYGFFFLIPALGVNRMAALVYLLVFALHFANKQILLRVFAISVTVAVAIFVFNTQGFQEKTFNEGKGRLSDLSLNYYEGGENMNTSGRAGFMKYYEKGLEAAPLLGNGPRSDVDLLRNVFGSTAAIEVCNDYIAVRYSYGYIGLALLVFGLGATFISVFVRFQQEQNPYMRLVQSSALMMLIGFAMFMYSDNILKYTVFYPDLMFAVLGIVYAKYQS
jgi:hypothetical protein